MAELEDGQLFAEGDQYMALVGPPHRKTAFCVAFVRRAIWKEPRREVGATARLIVRIHIRLLVEGHSQKMCIGPRPGRRPPFLSAVKEHQTVATQ